MRARKTTIRKNIPVLIRRDTGEEFLLDKPKIIIGRLKSCDIVISEPTVSKKHAEISVIKNKVILKDLNSTNGTYVNGEEITERELHNNDIIKFDVFEFQIKIPSEDKKTIVRKVEEKERKKTRILKPEKKDLAVLKVLNGKLKNRKFYIRDVKTTIGREEGDIIIPEDVVSHLHCEIEYRDNKFFIKDLNSTNHTYVNDKIITEAEIKNGDIIKLGDIEIEFKDLIKEKIRKEGTAVMDESLLKEHLKQIKTARSKRYIKILVSIFILLALVGGIYFLIKHVFLKPKIERISLSKSGEFFTKERINTRPVFARRDDRWCIITASMDGNVYILDAITLKEKGKYLNGARITAGVMRYTVDDEIRFICGDEKGKILNINLDGNLVSALKEGELEGRIYGRITGIDLNLDEVLDIICLSSARYLYAINGSSLELFWQLPLEDKLTTGVEADDVNNDDVPDIFGVTVKGKVICVNGINGTILWEKSLNEKVETSPALSDFNGDDLPDVITCTREGNIYILNGRTGEVLYQYNTGERITSSPLTINSPDNKVPQIVIGTKYGRIICVDVTKNRMVYNTDTGIPEAISDGMAKLDLTKDGIEEIIAGSRSGFVYIIDGKTGNILASKNAGAWITTPLRIIDLNGDGAPEVVFGMRNGELVVMSIETLPVINYGKYKLFY